MSSGLKVHATDNILFLATNEHEPKVAQVNVHEYHAVLKSPKICCWYFDNQANTTISPIIFN